MTSAKTSAVIWARAAGHCQYAGCNSSLIGDLISGNEDGKFVSTPGITFDEANVAGTVSAALGDQ